MPLRILTVVVALVATSLIACSHQKGSTSPAVHARRGKALFAQQCAACHGEGGNGGPIGPSLRNERKRRPAGAIRAYIEDPQSNVMPKLYPSPLTKRDVDDVTAYVESM